MGKQHFDECTINCCWSQWTAKDCHTLINDPQNIEWPNCCCYWPMIVWADYLYCKLSTAETNETPPPLRDYPLCYMYNIVHNNMDFENALVEPRPISRLTRHSNSHQLRQPYCHTNAFQNSFFPKTISMWNSLSEEVFACPSLASFKYAVS